MSVVYECICFLERTFSRLKFNINETKKDPPNLNQDAVKSIDEFHNLVEELLIKTKKLMDGLAFSQILYLCIFLSLKIILAQTMLKSTR